MDFENMNIWCWIIPLLVGLLCAYFGYLWGKNNTTADDNNDVLKALLDKTAKLQTDLDSCTGKLEASTAANITAAKAAAATAIVATEVTPEIVLIPFDATAAKAAIGKTVKENDLKIVEGIGPKISGMFVDADIASWKTLSDSSVSDCQKVLDTGGDRYKIHDPASWPMQAKMAYEGKWKDLAKWQDEHKHGKL